jgi:hypothetical protein
MPGELRGCSSGLERVGVVAERRPCMYDVVLVRVIEARHVRPRWAVLRCGEPESLPSTAYRRAGIDVVAYRLVLALGPGGGSWHEPGVFDLACRLRPGLVSSLLGETRRDASARDFNNLNILHLFYSNDAVQLYRFSSTKAHLGSRWVSSSMPSLPSRRTTSQIRQARY